MSDDDECIHLMDPALCSICNGRDAASKRTPRAAVTRPPATPRALRAAKPDTAKPPGKRLSTTVVSTRSADTEESVEQYRAQYAGGREATFDAYLMVFFNTDAREFPGGFLAFCRCANAEPERKDSVPALVLRAERLMRAAGFEPETVAGARRWRFAD